MNKVSYRTSNKTDFQFPPFAKPLRILQLLVLLTFFSFVVYMTNLIFRNETVTPTLTIIFSILLLVLTTVFVFVLAVDIINQFDKHFLSETPMAGFSFVGFLLFSMTSIIITFYMITSDSTWVIIMILCLCIISTILFLSDLILCFSYWREVYLKKNKSYPQTIEDYEYPDADTFHLLKDTRFKKQPKCDLSTSISNFNQPTEYEESKNDHMYRKIGMPRRKEYADVSENTPTLAAGECVQVQTEPRKIFVAESQTHKLELKEAPVQTLQHSENYLRPDLPSCVIPTTNSICPAVLQLMKGEVASQYLRICRCEGPMMHEQQQHLQLQLLQSTNRELTPSESFLDQNKGADKATCFCPTSDSNLSSQTTLTKKVSKLTVFSNHTRNNNTQTIFPENTQDEFVSNKNFTKETDNTESHPKGKKLNPNERTESLADDIQNEKKVTKENSEILYNNNVLENKQLSTEKVIQMSQEAINRAEETLSAPGSYSKTKTPDDSLFSTASYSKLSSSTPNSILFAKKNKIEPINSNNVILPPIIKETVLKLRLPLEKTTTVEICGNQNEKQFSKPKEICSCLTQKRKHDLCTIQVQYIFQTRMGKIVCETCATPESIRIPQKLACSAKKCIKCYECRKVLSPPCKCSACNKN